MGVFIFPAFWLINTGSFLLMLVAHVVAFGVLLSLAGGPTPAMFSEMFGTRVRYSGASVGYTLASILGAALAPIIATSIFAATGSSLSISLYLAATAVISLISVLLISETRQTDIEETKPQESALLRSSANSQAPQSGKMRG